MKIWHWKNIGFAIAATLTFQVYLSACSDDQPVSSPNDTSEQAAPGTTETACAPMADQVPLQPAAVDLPFERFDFRPTAVEATETTLTFRGRRYAFTFCQRDRTWGVEALEVAPPVEADYAEYFESLGDPDYETITQQDQPYQARVRLDAAWLDQDTAPEDDLEQVVFELIKPGDSEPTAQVLYTNRAIIEGNLGASAGVPTITQTLATKNALWWTIGFEQGEGASGIATIIKYQLDQDEIAVWQPAQLGNAQITDLAIADDGAILWLGTQYSGEGNPYLPAQGLVAYRPADQSIQSYTDENSPLLGAIPTRLWVDGDTLWTASAHGVCEIDWANIESNDSWACWKFTAMATMPANQPMYPSLLADTAISSSDSTDPAALNPVEILWAADTDTSTSDTSLTSPMRYEIRYEPGLTTELNQGADYYVGPGDSPDDGYFWWPGQDWSWNGQRFVRPWDQVAVNYVGGGPQGLGPDEYTNYVANWKTMRGGFELLELTPDTTAIKYYSAWIDATDIEPWVTVTEATNAPLGTENPTDVVLTNLRQAAKN